MSNFHLLNKERCEIMKSNHDKNYSDQVIINNLLKKLPKNDNWCVEFGAWDGLYLSNTRKLILEHKYNAVLIECDDDKFKELKKLYSDNINVTTLNRRVSPRGPDTLDKILSDLNVPSCFDFLSIDIDGNDYHIWNSISVFSPKVVCIEFNQTIPNFIEFVQENNPDINQGCSILSLNLLAKEKGYQLINIYKCNAYFIKDEYYSYLNISDNSIEKFRNNLVNTSYIFFGYDGTIFWEGNSRLPWHHLVIKPSKLQILPSRLRKISYKYNKYERLQYYIILLFNNPEFCFMKAKNMVLSFLKKIKKNS